jgi:hypothetical protein
MAWTQIVGGRPFGLEPSLVAEIRFFGREGFSVRRVARMFDLRERLIRRIIGV